VRVVRQSLNLPTVGTPVNGANRPDLAAFRLQLRAALQAAKRALLGGVWLFEMAVTVSWKPLKTRRF
jgi:hypothetical protein